MGVWAPETVGAVAVYQLPAAEEADTLLGGDTPPSDIGTNPNDSHNPGPETRDSVPTVDNVRWARPFAARGLEPKFALRLPFEVLHGQLAPLGTILLPGGT